MPKFNATRRPIPASLRANDSYTFLMKELERVDQKIYEPLTGTDWPRDMPVITGGGLTESIVAVDVTYGSTGRDQNNLIFDATNDIPVIQADLSQSIARCFNFAEYLSFSVLEREKMRSVGRDPEAFLNKGIRLHCDKIIDQNVYTGFTRVSSTGLINNPRIMRVSSPATGTGNSSKWADKTADQILDDINTLIAGVWKVCDCSSDALPDHILVPVEQFGLLVTRKVSDDSERSILTYVLENNLTNQQGGHLVISPCKWLSGAGSNYADRMVCYINSPDKICFNLTQPLKRMDTEYAEMRIKIPYIAQFSEVRFLYPQTVRYMDGI
ncbi:MAG: DUF2184 domain-containing protein [Firmicutes bacterium]|nr:DUF2184 domain-containing protein [Bacillota bacterium]